MRAIFLVFALALAFPLSSVASAGAPALPPAARTALDQLLERGRQSHSDAIVVMRDGREIAHYYPDGAAPGPIDLMSVTKSVVALGIGQLLGEGKLKSLDQPVADFYPEWRQGRKKDITVRMLLDHTSGLQNLPRTEPEIYPAPDAVQLALAAELDSAPGVSFAYNNKAVNLLAGVVEKASGQSMDVYVRQHLFEPMGIRPGRWLKDRAGHPYAMADLALTAADTARIGQLVLDGGRWQGRQLVPADFIRQMLSPSARMPSCGLLWWLQPAWMRGNFRHDAVARMLAAGVPAPVAMKFSPLQGKPLGGDAAFAATMETIYGKDAMEGWRTQIASHIGLDQLTDRASGPGIAYDANGDLGQCSVIVPQANLVAVRQIAEGHYTGDADRDEDFLRQVVTLARGLGVSVPSGPRPTR